MKRAPRLRLDELSCEAMVEIASHLDTKSLLTLRLVSRHFSSLSHLPVLTLQWDTDDADADASLALFIRRHCASPESPSVVLKAKEFQSEVLVRMLPACVEGLHIFTAAQIVDDKAMARLRCLKHLTLKRRTTGDSMAYAAHGIMCLPKLQKLTLEPARQAEASFLDACLLKSTSLQQLQISGVLQGTLRCWLGLR
ncbi:hypothetical protein WJX74_005080 [Apatococcus lobatus]|uniref:F-box domain-containing protein n=1 Tax=Apatococcus lobatus TaxID=904363 RepID=A0AAW1RAD8_9CHLO